MEIKQLEKVIESAKQALSARQRLAQYAENCTSSAIPKGSVKNHESLAEAYESDLLQIVHESYGSQLRRLLKDVERLNFWQAHNWYAGECTADNEWRFFDAGGNSCKGNSLREALDQLRVIQRDLRGQMSDDDAWEG